MELALIRQSHFFQIKGVSELGKFGVDGSPNVRVFLLEDVARALSWY